MHTGILIYIACMFNVLGLILIILSVTIIKSVCVFAIVRSVQKTTTAQHGSVVVMSTSASEHGNQTHDIVKCNNTLKT